MKFSLELICYNIRENAIKVVINDWLYDENIYIVNACNYYDQM